MAIGQRILGEVVNNFYWFVYINKEYDWLCGAGGSVFFVVGYIGFVKGD